MSTNQPNIQSNTELTLEELALVHGGGIPTKIEPGDEFTRIMKIIDDELRTYEKWKEDWQDYF